MREQFYHDDEDDGIHVLFLCLSSVYMYLLKYLYAAVTILACSQGRLLYI